MASRHGTARPELTFAAACGVMVNQFLIWGMSRLTPLIIRRAGPRAVAISMPQQAEPLTEAEAAAWMADLKLFLTGWLGGLVFFGTLLS